MLSIRKFLSEKLPGKFSGQPSVPYPNVWLTFEAPDENGDLVKYRIQDLPLERCADAIDHLRANFLVEETICRARDMANDEASIEDLMYAWREIINEDKMTLVCFKEGSDEIIGINVLYVDEGEEEDEDEEEEYESKHVEDMDLVADFMWDQCDVFEHYKIDCFLSSYGMSVLPKYRRRGIALKFLEARKHQGKAYGVPLTSDLFSSSESQKLAEKAGFEKNFEITFEELTKKNPRYLFDVSKGTTFAMYSMRL